MRIHGISNNIYQLKYSVYFFILFTSITIFSNPKEYVPKDFVTITVNDSGIYGFRQIFRGYGISQNISDLKNNQYTRIPTILREDMIKLLYKDFRPSYLKIVYDPYDTTNTKTLTTYYNDVIKQNPTIKILFSARGWFDTLSIPFCDKKTTACTNWLKRIKDNTNIPINYVSIRPPGNYEKDTSDFALYFIKTFKNKMDSLQINAKLIAPDWYQTQNYNDIINKIINNLAVSNKISAFSMASSIQSVSDKTENLIKDQIEDFYKELWVTGDIGTGDYTPEMNTDVATNITSVFLADINHLCNVWTLYSGIGGKDDVLGPGGYNISSWNTILYNPDSTNYTVLLKYYYFKQLSKTFEPGCKIYKSVASFGGNPDYWKSTDTTMTVDVGHRAPIYSATGKNSDGTWGIAITNYTGFEQTHFYYPRKKTIFNVTVKFKNFEDSKDIEFKMYRVNSTPTSYYNKDNSYCHEEGTVIMHNGTLVIDSIGQYDLITLRSKYEPTVSVLKNKVYTNTKKQNIFIKKLNKHSSLINFNVSSITNKNTVPVDLSIYNTHGQKVISLIKKNLSVGDHQITWNTDIIPIGMYLIRFKIGNKLIMKNFNLVK